MRVALAEQLGGIENLELVERPDPLPAAGKVLIRVYGAGAGPWDVGFLSGGFPGVDPPFVPGQEVAGIVEGTGDGTSLQPGDRVYASLFPAGGGFAELALASADRTAHMPDQASFEEAAGLVIGAGTAHDGLVDRGRLQTGETVLITAAAGGVGTAAVQIAAALSARPMGVASPSNHEFVLGLGASDVFDYHSPNWAQQVLTVVPDGVDVLFDCVGGQTMDQAVGAVRNGGRVISVIPPFGDRELDRGIMAESFAASGGRERLEALSRLVDAGQLRAQVEAILPLVQVREGLRRVAGRHARGKVVIQPQQ
jgi:NADPH:quinone reductase